MSRKNKSFMDENFGSNTVENNEFSINSEESEYKNLITLLKEISSTIALLEKKYINKS